ncbi:nuclear transport factor 2 family protein [Psychroserpens sp.]|uniref:nuclear transport factor 2 family protein n=1 Tax=Psychroserpens sp. TaxID=2020870 RepID=UPI001AFDA440|nr:nuclear transport factor 2 family protein [Psychroserpens sp.]MBO6607030.1 nuclear transport factor 2 family protein [Psychroserpens sp.]MBO6654176.1 nuclear transport factor 2 family protein [Psychroserpens sp.]MBO6682538.1 nuclear transport factor 2 family protein [Psychroserpens sp.]MBO6750802.1 nuclear transport factor 2 family protein [Psychroserpens sp.]MBO6915769.1 nuclear transport factor 2 family protein [Psychroserpens sp.]
MKQYFSFLFLFALSLTFAQPNTDIFLFDINSSGSSISVENGENISNNEGYDNQPSFMNDRYILFSSTRDGQTDIAKYDTRYGSKTWLNFTEGGEYTPLKIPNKNQVSAVRLDPNGKQRLYAYDRSDTKSTELIADLVVAYYTWFNEDIIVSAVIEGEQLNLFVSDLKNQTNRKYATQVGRSFHKIPNSNLVSFISKENDTWQIKSLNPLTGETKLVANTIEGVEDICWMDSKTLLSGKDSMLYKLRLKRDNNWKQVQDLSTNGISKITRLSVNTVSTKLLIAGELSTSATSETTTSETSETNENSSNESNDSSSVEAIVQRNLEAYNAKNIDAFMSDYADDIKLYAYPNQLQTEGKDAMRKSYQSWFERAQGLNAAIKKRIVIGNKVIDEEEVTANGQTFHAVAIYEVNNGKITKVTFIQ